MGIKKDTINRKPNFFSHPFVLVLLVGGIFFAITAAGSLLFSSGYKNIPLWVPMGIGIALSLRFGSRIFPGILLGLLGAYFFHFSRLQLFSPLVTIALSLGSSAGIFAGIAVAWFSIKRFVSDIQIYRKIINVFKFVIIAALTALLTGIVMTSIWITAGLLELGEHIPFTLNFCGALIADILLFFPLVVSWSRKSSIFLPREKAAELILVIVLLIFGGIFPVIVPLSGFLNRFVPYLFMPLLIWTVFRYTVKETTLIIFLFVVLMVLETSMGSGPFANSSVFETILAIQGFSAFVAFIGLLMSATLIERRRSEEDLTVLNENLEKIIKERTDELTSVNKQLKEEQNLFFSGIAVIFKWKNEEGWPVIYTTPNVEDIFGYPKADFIQRRISYLELIHPDDVERVTSYKKLAIKQEINNIKLDYRVVTKSGSVVWLYDSTLIVKDEDEEVIHFLGYVIDITVRKNMEKEIRDSHERLELALKGADIGLWDWHISNDEVYFGYRWLDLLGYDIGEVAANMEGWKELVHPEDRERFFTKLWTHIKNDSIMFEDEHRILTKDGTWKWFLARGKLVEKDGFGKPFRASGTYLDISERKRTERELKEKEEFLRNVIDTNPNLIYVKDHEHKFLLTNDALARMYDTSVDRIIGKTDADLNPFKDEVDKFYWDDSFVLGALQTKIIPEEKVTAKDGTIRWFQTIKSPIYNSETGAYNVLGVSTDITLRKQVEETLRTSEHTLAETQRVAKLGSWEYEVDTKLLHWSEETFRIAGMDDQDEAPVFEDYLDTIHPEDREFYVTSLETAIYSGESFEIVVRHRKPDGLYNYTLTNAIPQQEGGRVVRLLGSILDITERETIKLEIDRTRIFLENIINNIPLAIYVRNAREDSFGVIELWNRTCEEIFGVSASQAHGRLLGDLLPIELTFLLEEGDREVFSEERLMVLPDQQVMTEQAGVRILRTIKVPIYKEGKPHHLLCISEDITEKVKMSEALENSEKNLKAIMANMTDGLITFDAFGKIRSFNPSAEKIFGYIEKDILRTPFVGLIAPSGEKNGQSLPDFINDDFEEDRYYDISGVREDGTVFPLELSVSIMHLEAETSYIAIARDISERKKVEKMKNEFISTVSHELKTPLTSIKGAIGLIVGGVGGEIPSKVQNLLDVAYRNSDRLSNLISDILDLEKIESGSIEYKMEAHSVWDLLDQAVKSNLSYADQYGVKLSLQKHTAEVRINVDENRFHQIISNLLSNAVKYSPAGGIVSVFVDYAADTVTVNVADKGPGIPEGFRDRIFSKFAQADSSDTRKKGGTGLGLSIVKKLVENMNGSVGFTSGHGEGTRFYFSFPRL